MNIQGSFYRWLAGAMLLGACPGCWMNVEEPKPKRGVDVKIERGEKGLDVGVDVNKPAKP